MRICDFVEMDVFSYIKIAAEKVGALVSFIFKGLH